jgi:F0F1-type ATP synthase epsilon subunit
LDGSLLLTVLTPERILLRVERASKVRLRLADQAWLSVYRNHAPLLAETASGPVQYETDVEAGELNVGPGILWVAENRVEVLTSGLSVPEAAGDEPAEEQTFERLARQLLSTLAPASGSRES